MIKIVLMVPEYAENRDIIKTYECIEKSELCASNTVVIVYSECDAQNVDVSSLNFKSKFRMQD
jgi:hypothetical protein